MARAEAQGARTCSADALAIDREADRAADRGHDPEAQDDLGLRPCAQLKMMVNRRHQKDAFAERLKGDHLDRNGQRLDHEDAAEQYEQQLGLGHHRQARDRSAEAERARIPHEDRRWEGVEPQKADAASDQAAGDHREVVLAGDEGDAHVREQHDRSAPSREAVETVGEIDGARRSGDDQVDQHRVERPEVDLIVDEAQAQCAGQVRLVAGDEPQAERYRDRDPELRPRPQAERAPAHELGVVVGKPEQRTADGGGENPHRAPVVVAEDQERDRHGDEDEHAAHRRRPRLLEVSFGALLADVLAELPLAQELDELGAQEDADQQRRGAAEEDAAHQLRRAPAAGAASLARALARPTSARAPSASATRSSATPREPFTSTVSPLRSSPPRASAAVSASATARASPANAASMFSASGPTVTSRSTPRRAACAPSWR